MRYLSDRIAVLYLGRVMELGPAEQVFNASPPPVHRGAAVGRADARRTGTERIRLEGEIPSAADPPSGCVFHTRCPRKIGEICETTEPELREEEAGHGIRCHIPLAELRRLQGNEDAVASAPAAPSSSSE